jgi:hypothetical protein
MPKFAKGTSGNPGGRPKRQIANLGLEARKFADLALDVLVQVCKGGIKGVTPRDRLMAANSLLDRGFGRPVQSIDMLLLGRKIAELSDAELAELSARLVSAGAVEQPREEMLN